MDAERSKKVGVVVREYDAEKDLSGAEAVDRMCEVGPSGTVSLFTDLLGDPICRVRHSPAFLMLVSGSTSTDSVSKLLTNSRSNVILFIVSYTVAETTGPEKGIVGIVRGCVKTITCGKKTPRPSAAVAAVAAPIYTKAAYILGLRVSPCHRRMGIGLKLVERMEDWFRSNGAEYAYMATEKDNEASLRLFTDRCGYTKFRTPKLLVQPVFAHSLGPRAALISLRPTDAESLYRRRFSATEFFPRDIDAVLRNPLSLGTFLAVPSGSASAWTGSIDRFLAEPPESWAVLSVWDCKSLFRLEVRNAPLLWRGLSWTTRAVDRVLPWLRVPSVPDLFRPFGGYFLYGLGGDGPSAASLLRSLCRHAHNMALAGGCSVIATEVSASEPLISGIPHWRRLSFDEDLWCIKRLAEEYSDGAIGDWTRSPPGSSIFVDPREV
ncbi:hypothetical protein HPP92_007760 [Vanilla planifolia]|uniref:N-acetyltransferase domain-containing protein n=1 Tax=Vanilla planifolia TaxID=51239 RepID=A0A835V673_VANPL|nr:hypothetical protein HPP92_007760 [Vanilla planifolia]